MKPVQFIVLCASLFDVRRWEVNIIKSKLDEDRCIFIIFKDNSTTFWSLSFDPRGPWTSNKSTYVKKKKKTIWS